VFAYHEIVRAPGRPVNARLRRARCDVYYRGTLSPDFYGWVFPHGDTMSIGTGSADKGFSLRGAVGELREAAAWRMRDAAPRRRADPDEAAEALGQRPRRGAGRRCRRRGRAGLGRRHLLRDVGGRWRPRRRTRSCHRRRARAGRRAQALHEGARPVFWVLGIMQRFWYSSDKRRERFVSICKDKDVQQLTFESYMNKELVRKKPMAHVRIFFKDMAHLLGLARVDADPRCALRR
jgi:geranylgeranyl diphosphate/geranylgeranyl-bacteriochlorophyllide a reductase